MESVASPLEDFIRFANDNSLEVLVNDVHFVEGIFVLAFDEASDLDTRLASIVVDKFHDHFSLSSSGRQAVTKAIMRNETTIKELYDEGMSGKVAAPIAPQARESSIDGLTGPYPAPRPGSPEAMSVRTTPRASSTPPRPKPGADSEVPKETSNPTAATAQALQTGLRFKDTVAAPPPRGREEQPIQQHQRPFAQRSFDRGHAR